MGKLFQRVTVVLCWLGVSVASGKGIKNVILVVGDGMGPQQIGLLETFARLGPGLPHKSATPSWYQTMAQSSQIGLSMHYPEGGMVVDSACSATQLATGLPAGSEMIGLDAKGRVVETVLEKAQKSGRSTGLVSDTRLTHATPAAFAAHVGHRSLENDIAAQMLGQRVDVMMSGGARHFLPKSDPKSKRKDNRDLIKEARAAGYQVGFDRSALLKVKKAPFLGLFAKSGMMDGIQYHRSRSDKKRTEPSLPEMTSKALQLLEPNPKGFFLMVEAGQIDWAGHQNDTATMLHEMLKMDETLGVIYNWVKDRDDTVVIVTADHETGSFGFSYSSVNLPKPKKLEGEGFAGKDFKPNYNFGAPEVLGRLMQQKKSLVNMISAFDALPAKDQTPKAMAAIINENSAFKVNPEGGVRILQTTANEFYAKGHSSLGAKERPFIRDFAAFYPYGEMVRANLIGRELATEQNVVWGTGTHTHTPVPVLVFGGQKAKGGLSGVVHHTDIGKFMLQQM